MDYAEPSAAQRRVPVALVSPAGDPVEGFEPGYGEIQVSKSGSPWENAAGVFEEVSGGVYSYEATIGEVSTPSFMLLKIVGDGVMPFIYAVDIGEGIHVAESEGEARRIPVYLVDPAGDPVTGAAGLTILLSQAGGELGPAGAALVEIGDGAYYYQLELIEVTEAGASILAITGDGIQPYVYSWDVLEDPLGAQCDDLLGGALGGCGDECHDLLGGMLGGCGEEEDDEEGGDDGDDLVPIPAPYTPDDPEYVDHVAEALSRLVTQLARAGS